MRKTLCSINTCYILTSNGCVMGEHINYFYAKSKYEFKQKVKAYIRKFKKENKPFKKWNTFAVIDYERCFSLLDCGATFVEREFKYGVKKK